jgi:hypothetical protein
MHFSSRQIKRNTSATARQASRAAHLRAGRPEGSPAQLRASALLHLPTIASSRLTSGEGCESRPRRCTTFDQQ